MNPTNARLSYRKKLIEVDLPLNAINEQADCESTAQSGHPWRLHVWWARRRQVACRAVVFASLVDDPSSCLDEFPTQEAQRIERDRLHRLIERLVVWKDSGDVSLINEVRYEIARSVARSRSETTPSEPAEVLSYLNDKAQPIYDPFCGGGSIPLEAQWLGLRAVGSDLNPVAVLITKSLIEIPQKFAHRAPINPDADPLGMTVGKGKKKRKVAWRGATGLADDIRYFGRWVREEAFRRIGYLYPSVELPGAEIATVTAWLWARTVPCPNPACGLAMPLLKSFELSTKVGNMHWIKPVADCSSRTVTFEVQSHAEGVPENGAVVGRSVNCVFCKASVPLDYVPAQARAGNMAEQMMAIVAKGNRSRIFLTPSDEDQKIPLMAKAKWRPNGKLPERALGFRVQRYGFTNWEDFFTERQMVAHTTFCDLLGELPSVMTGIDDEYSKAISTYLALALGKLTEGNCRFTRWQRAGGVASSFSSPRVSMLWDFAETNPFSDSTKNWIDQVDLVAKAVENLPSHTNASYAYQADAATTRDAGDGVVIVTDPPYYANIGYADLSDFFYVWLRPVLQDFYPDLFASMLTPKNEEIVAAPRFNAAHQRFENLLEKALTLIRSRCSPEFPASIYYAYKQQVRQKDGEVSTGWETMLSALIIAGFQVVGTWPMRIEKSNRLRSLGSNSLASSVVLVCRPRPYDAPVATRRHFLDALEVELPRALDQLTREGHIAPVDLAQAAIGPGMQVYSRFSRVETIGGEPVPVREALVAINRVIAEYDERQQGELDSATRFCVDWLRQYGYAEKHYGEAEVLAQAKNVSVEELRDSKRLLDASAGQVSLLPLDDYGPNRPLRLGDMTAWEGAFRMAYHLNREDGLGIIGAASVAQRLGSKAESVERLARILYNHFDRKRDSPNAVLFNNLVTEWPRIMADAQSPEQARMI